MTREIIKSARVHCSTGLPEVEERREARRMRYVGVVMESSNRDCAREMKTTLKTKKSHDGILLRTISQR
jgi:hypothetical protein